MGGGQEFAEIVILLSTIFVQIKLGLIIAGIASVSHTLTALLAKFEWVEKPDPTVWMRTWERQYQRHFHPFGSITASYCNHPKIGNQVYYFTICAVALVTVFSMYFILSGATIGAMLVTYYSMGFAPDMSPLIHQIAGICVLFGFAVIWHAAGKEYQTADNISLA